MRSLPPLVCCISLRTSGPSRVSLHSRHWLAGLALIQLFDDANFAQEREGLLLTLAQDLVGWNTCHFLHEAVPEPIARAAVIDDDAFPHAIHDLTQQQVLLPLLRTRLNDLLAQLIQLRNELGFGPGLIFYVVLSPVEQQELAGCPLDLMS